MDLANIFKPSEEIVAREIEDEIIIVPLTSGIADMEDELFTLNDTAKDIWRKLDGQRSLQQIIDELAQEYDAEKEKISQDVAGLIAELEKRKIVIALP